MKKYYAVIDTNVIVSAALRWKSVTGNIKHFPMEPFVVTPRAMLDIVLENIDDNYYGNIY